MKKPNVSSSNPATDYREQRDALMSRASADEVAAAPYVYVERQSFTTALTRIDLFRKALEVQGSIVECGVHKANSLFLYHHLSTCLEPYNFNRKIIGFDTFEGFRSITDHDDNKRDKLRESDFSDTEYETILAWSKVQELNTAIPSVPRIELVKGDAVKTIPKYVDDNPHLIIALLYLDFDLYAPTAAALEHLLPLVPKGGIVGLDELNSRKWQGETIALKERLVLADISLRKFSYDPWVSYFVVE